MYYKMSSSKPKPKYKYVFITYNPPVLQYDKLIDFYEWLESRLERSIVRYASVVEYTQNPHPTKGHLHCIIEFGKPSRLQHVGLNYQQLFKHEKKCELIATYPCIESVFMRQVGYCMKEAVNWKEHSQFRHYGMTELVLNKCYDLFSQYAITDKIYEQRHSSKIVLSKNNFAEFLMLQMEETGKDAIQVYTDLINSRKYIFRFMHHKLQVRVIHEAPNWTYTMTKDNLMAYISLRTTCGDCGGMTLGLCSCTKEFDLHERVTAVENLVNKKRKLVNAFEQLSG